MRIVQLATVLFLIVQTTVFAQKPTDNSRAQRDIVVLRNLMNEYFQNANPEPKKYVLSQSRSDIKYFPGFGLLISAPTYQLFNNRAGIGYVNDCACEDDAKKAEADTKKETTATLPENDKIIGIMKDFVAEYPNLMDIVQPGEKVVFYYDKTSRLGGGDVIVINRSYSTATTTTENKAKPRERIMLTFAPNDLKLAPAELKNKIKVKTETQEEKTKPEFNIMGKIFADVFDNTSRSKFQASNQYFTFSTTRNTSIESRSRANYEYFEGLGIIYKFEASYQGLRVSRHNYTYNVNVSRAYQATVNVNGQAVITEDDAVKEGKNEKQKDKSKEKAKTPRAPEPARANDESAEETAQNNRQKVADDYKLFVQDVKNYLIEYGRTLRSLAPAERLVVTVKLNRIDRYLMPAQAPGETEKSTKSDGFQLPRQVEFSVPQSVLDEYDKRSLSLEEAAAKVTMREYAKNETASSGTSFWFEVED